MKLEQPQWEYWFVTACIIFLGNLFLGTLPNSMDEIPYWPYYTALSLLNLIVCIYYGTKVPKD